MLSRNVDVYYVLNQRKKYTFAMFSEHMKFYHAMQLCMYNCLTSRDCNRIDNGLVLFC